MKVLSRLAQNERLVQWAIRVWVTAIFALLIPLTVMRVINGPGDSALLQAWILVLGAPILVMLLGLVVGWVWFALWLVTFPIPPLHRWVARLPGVLDGEPAER